MKKTILLSGLVAFIISFLTIGAFYKFNDGFPSGDNDTITIQKVDGLASNVLYTTDGEGNIQPLNFEKVAAKVMDAVVSVKSKVKMQASGRQQYLNPFEQFFQSIPGQQFHFKRPNYPEYSMGMGSGVIINEKGYIVTNYHVIKNASDITVTLHDNREYEAEVIGTDPTTDLALLKIDGAENLTTLPLVNSDEVRVGQWVLAVGNPFGLTSTVTAGIISAKARNINILDSKYAVESYIQTDAAINKGNSGGALVTLQGGLVGINSAIYSPSGAYSGYGFAIPSNLVSKVVQDLLKYGTVQRGFLGVSIANVTSDLIQKQALEVTEGAYIVAVKENSAASSAGIQKGDVITRVDDQPVHSSPKLQELIAIKHPGDEVQLTIMRNGKQKNFNVTLLNRKGTTKIIKGGYVDAVSQLGIELRALSAQEVADLNIDGGVLIEQINNGRIANETSIREGLVILEVDGKKVSTIDEINKILSVKQGDYVEIKGIYKGIPGVYYYGIALGK